MVRELTMSTQMIDLTKDIKVDIRSLLRADGEDAYFRVDDIVQKFEGKDIRAFFQKDKSKDRHEYRRVLLEYKKLEGESSLELSSQHKKLKPENGLELSSPQNSALQVVEKPYDGKCYIRYIITT